MPEKTPGSYGEAVTRAQALVRAGRLADPGEHFPYKHDQVTALLEENPPAGPKGKDDDSLRVSDFMSVRIADATKAYVRAQEAYLRDPGDATLADYQEATDDLVAARRAHRRRRGGEMAISGQGA
jgi:hypothetical protein